MIHRLCLTPIITLALFCSVAVAEAPQKDKSVIKGGYMRVPDPKQPQRPRGFRVPGFMKPAKPEPPDKDPFIRVPEDKAQKPVKKAKPATKPLVPKGVVQPPKPSVIKKGVEKKVEKKKKGDKGLDIVGAWRHVAVYVKPRTIRLDTGETITHKGRSRVIEVYFNPDHSFRLIVRRTGKRTVNSRGVWQRKKDLVRTRFTGQKAWTETRILKLTARTLKVRDVKSNHVTMFQRIK